jgi:SAM-dependent methyltransferase
VGTVARYDGFAAWYEEFRPALREHEAAAIERLLGAGPGRCLDLACGNGVAVPVLAGLGWSPVGVDVSAELLELARGRGATVVRADVTALPFEDGSFDAALSVWSHTDVDDFAGLLREAGRALRPGAPFVYLGAHPCFIGPHSTFLGAIGVPELHAGYSTTGRYDTAPGIRPEGVRARVGATHLTLAGFLQAFPDAGLALERLEELADDDYPYMVALRARR